MSRILCRDCAELTAAPAPRRCPACGSPRQFAHPELTALTIAHVDCDAFYATVEKRDDPRLRDRPVIVGGGTRGVVSAACYVARRYGVRSAMPMFKALAACPHAAVIKPNMAKYQAAGRQVRAIFESVTPLVQPISIDEAFLDLTGTEPVHGSPAAATMARMIRRIEREVGITASVGLSYNKFLAKTASELDKPRGFAAIGRTEVLDFLAPRPVGTIWGVGPALQRRLASDGIATIGQLQQRDEADLVIRYGSMGRRLFSFARGQDERVVNPEQETRSISAETTFNSDLTGEESLRRALWPLCERVAQRMKQKGFAGRTVVLKLKTAKFRSLTRSHALEAPTMLAERIFRTGVKMLAPVADGTPYRLIGIGVAGLTDAAEADPPDLFDGETRHIENIERAIDAVRERLGPQAIGRARG
jgi:DNA polymerase-4